MVEEIDDGDNVRAYIVPGPTVPVAGNEYALPEELRARRTEGDARITQCVAAIDQLGMPPDAGAPTVREALRDSGQRYTNDVIAAAVKERRALSGTGKS